MNTLQTLKVLYGLEAKIDKQTTSPGYGQIHYSLTSNEKISEDMAKEVQMLLGYHPAGYGFYRYTGYFASTGKWVASWQSSRSCD